MHFIYYKGAYTKYIKKVLKIGLVRIKHEQTPNPAFDLSSRKLHASQ